MRILLVGSGGREHALAWALSRSPELERLYAIPGNPGIASLGLCLDIDPLSPADVSAFACEERMDLAVIGPEAPLVAGVSDALRAQGIPTLGPSSRATRIEASKVFCRDLARRHGVRVAQGEEFDDPSRAADFARALHGRVVVKADGLAGGKGVIICDDAADAVRTIDSMMRERTFGDAGSQVIVEEYLDGRETSFFCLTDGRTILPLETAQDYKKAFDGDRGLNTGGMGAYSPSWLSPELRDRALKQIVEPIVHGLASEGRPYVGCIYAGLMLVKDDIYLIEINARFGDPETQVVMPRLRGDLASLALACASGRLDGERVEWSGDAAVCVVVAAKDYDGSVPDQSRTGLAIDGLDDARAVPGVEIFHAGTAVREGRLVSSSGRVLNVSARGATLDEARTRAYEAVRRIRMDGARYRSDIAS